MHKRGQGKGQNDECGTGHITEKICFDSRKKVSGRRGSAKQDRDPVCKGHAEERHKQTEDHPPHHDIGKIPICGFLISSAESLSAKCLSAAGDRIRDTDYENRHRNRDPICGDRCIPK